MIGATASAGRSTATDHNNGGTRGRKAAAIVDLDGHHNGIGLHGLDLCVGLRAARVNIGGGVGWMTIIGILDGGIGFIWIRKYISG